MFDFKKFLKEGGVEKYLLEAQFGNDIESRYQYIRPLMSRLPDSARTEAMIDGMEEARAEDDKMAFDFYFVETMKMLGLETELMEADSLINPEAEEIDSEDLDAAADYYDSLAENDTILDEFLQMPAQEEEEEEEEGANVEVLDDVEELEIEKEQEVTININLQEGKFEVGDYVVFADDWKTGSPMRVTGMRKMFASPLHAIKVTKLNGETAEYDETQLVKLMSPEEKANAFVREGEIDIDEILGEGFFDRLQAKASGTGAGLKQRVKNVGAALKGDKEQFVNPTDANHMAQIRSITNDTNEYIDDALADLTKLFAGRKVDPKTQRVFDAWKEEAEKLKNLQQMLLNPEPLAPDNDKPFTNEEVEGEVQSEAMSNQLKINKLLQAANTIEDSLNDVNLELTDDQIDKFTEMILDLRAKAKASLKENEGQSVTPEQEKTYKNLKYLHGEVMNLLHRRMAIANRTGVELNKWRDQIEWGVKGGKFPDFWKDINLKDLLSDPDLNSEAGKGLNFFFMQHAKDIKADAERAAGIFGTEKVGGKKLDATTQLLVKAYKVLASAAGNYIKAWNK